MRVTKAEFKILRDTGADIKISNGNRDFIISVDKKNLTFNDLVSYSDEMNIKVYSMIRNCCAACPIVVLEKGKNEADDDELKEVLHKVIDILGNELKERLYK